MNAGRIGATGLALFAAVAATLVFAGPASAATSKPYSLDICDPGQTPPGQVCTSPSVIAPGAGTAINPSQDTLTATLTNLNKPGSGITLGSDNLSVPSPPPGFSVTGVIIGSPPAGTDQTCPTPLSQQGPPCYTLLNGGTTVELRNLNIPATSPASSVAVSLQVDTPAPSTTFCTSGSPCVWTDVAKQSNDFSGTGNDLGNPETGVRGTVLSAATTCQGGKPCFTTLADDATASAGSISVTVNTTSGANTVSQTEAIDFGRLDFSPAGLTACAGVESDHYVYWNLSTGASDRSEQVSITTAAAFPGYQQEFCLQTNRSFTAKTAPGSTGKLAKATKLTLPDGTIVYQGLLPDCGTPPLQALQVNCQKDPGVLSRSSPLTFPTTTVAEIPPGFDARAGN